MFDSIRFIYDIDTVELTRGVEFMAVVYTVSHGLSSLVRPSYGLTRSLTVLYDRNYDYTRTWHPCQFFKSFKIHTRLSRIHSNGLSGCNSDKATVGSVVCTVYTDVQPYKPCVLCQTGLTVE